MTTQVLDRPVARAKPVTGGSTRFSNYTIAETVMMRMNERSPELPHAYVVAVQNHWVVLRTDTPDKLPEGMTVIRG